MTWKQGHKPWNTGKRYPAPWLEKYRFGTREKPIHKRKEKYTAEDRKRIWGNPHRGKPISKAHKLALLHSLQGNKFNLGKKRSQKMNDKRSQWALEHRDLMRANGIKGNIKRGQETSIEMIIYQKLKDWGIIYEKHYTVNGKFIVDAFLPDHNIVIEVDGSYWHNLDRVKKKDKAENAYLTKCGYKVIRIPEKEVSDFSVASLYKRNHG